MNIPDDFICPISRDIMSEPVSDKDGHSYDKQFIVEWMRFMFLVETAILYKQTKCVFFYFSFRFPHIFDFSTDFFHIEIILGRNRFNNFSNFGI